MALVTLWQSGSAEGDYNGYSYGSSRGYHWSDDEDEDDYDETGTEYEMGELFDHSLSANHWSDRHGTKVRLGEIQLDENEIVAEGDVFKGSVGGELQFALKRAVQP